LSLKSLPYLMVFACGVGATVVFRAITKVKIKIVKTCCYLFFNVPFKPVVPTLFLHICNVLNAFCLSVVL
jgi:hypothetical protein